MVVVGSRVGDGSRVYYGSTVVGVGRGSLVSGHLSDGGSVSDGSGVVGDWSRHLGNRGSICDGSGLVSHRSHHLSDGGDDLSGVDERLFMHDSVKTVVGVSGVLNSAFGAVGVNDGVGALYDITVAGFLLGLGVTSVPILYVVGEAVLWVGIVSFNLGYRGSVRHRSGDLGYWGRSIVGGSALDSVAGVSQRCGVGNLSSR